mmetsp:Transcript_25321/g.76031  ORF Transcript_25321/g.76031 Transcript_25321/m.76031 type:complete len:220 (-) Transcript_25321:16-675(-)
MRSLLGWLLLTCAATLAPVTRVRTRTMNDAEIMRRASEVGPLVRAFSAARGSRRGGGVSTLDVADAAEAKKAAQVLVDKRQKLSGTVLVAQRTAAPRDLVGFALVSDDLLDTMAVAVPERGRGVGAQLVDAAADASRRAGNSELLVEVESFNGKGRAFFEGQGFASTGEKRGALSILARPLPFRPPVLAAAALVLAGAAVQSPDRVAEIAVVVRNLVAG